MPCIGGRRFAIGIALPVIFVVLFIMFPSWQPSATAGSTPEIGYSADRSSARGPLFGPAGVDLQLGAGWMSLLEDDMDGNYGGLPLLDARFVFSVGPRDRLFLGAGYGWTDGDPFFDRPADSGEGLAELRMVPLRTGYLRTILAGRNLCLDAGFLVELVWSRETLPSSLYNAPGDPVRTTRWTAGVGAVVGSRWFFADGRRSLGLEAALTGNSGSGFRDDSSTEINLSGLLMRIYGSIHLGGGDS